MKTVEMFINKYDATPTLTLVPVKEGMHHVGLRKTVMIDPDLAQEYRRIMSEFIDLQHKLEQLYYRGE